MIFDESAVCTPVFCREVTGETPVLLPAAPFTVVLASSGRAAASADSEPVLLAAGGLFLAGGAAVEVTPVTGCHVLAAGFPAQLHRPQPRACPPLASDCSACPMAAQLLGELAAAMERGGAAGLSALCYHILCELAAADAAVPRLSPLVADAVLAIRQNYAGLYGVEELSAQLGVSKSHLVRVFSAEMGVGPGQYLTGVRLDAAKALLARRDYPLEVVATLCGFSGANYLCKVFKKHTGQTPAAFRAQNAGAARGGAVNELESALYI
ncbi:MAG: helix-turn-helix transcriptional regulator [Ruthenibacterium lactatiformans]